MRIGIDAHMVGSHETGNETYIANLTRGLAAVDGRNSYHLYVLAAHLDTPALPRRPNVARHPVRPATNVVRIPLSYPALAWRHRLDLLHFTYVTPPLVTCPVVVTVHDVAFRLFKAAFSPRDRLVLSLLVPRSLRAARRVTTVSQHTKSELVRHYGIDAEKVVVTYAAAAERFRPLDMASARGTAARYGVSPPYVLAVGNLQPRKNLERLIEAFAALRGGAGTRHQLVLVGKSAWRGSRVEEAVRRLGLEGEVVRTGYVPDEDLPALYIGASLFVYPSLYEGFGLPILEAMACGTPVITSHTSSMPEVAGDAALLVDPYDVQQIAQAMERALSDADLRQRLGGAGVERAALFTWEKTARATLAVYEEVLAGRRHQGR